MGILLESIRSLKRDITTTKKMMKEMIPMEPLMRKLRNDHCPVCDSDRSLEVYDMKNRPVRFTLFIDGGNLDRLKTKSLSYLKCRKCGAVFKIDWEGNESPYPLTDQKMNDFIVKYNGISKI